MDEYLEKIKNCFYGDCRDNGNENLQNILREFAVKVVLDGEFQTQILYPSEETKTC